MNLNTRIQKIIEYSMLTASEFADEIGVQRSNISHIISGRNKPSLDFIIKIKDRFPEIRWEWIIEGKGKMTYPSTSSESIQGSKINFDEDVGKEEKNDISVPDLFSLVEASSLVSPTPKIREKAKNLNPQPNGEEEKINDSQQLEIKENSIKFQDNENKYNKITKIIFFYENGKFEIFEP